MKAYVTTLLVAVSTSIIAQDLTQTFLNQNWVSINGLPEVVDWSASVVDSQRNLYITGNKATSNEGTNLTLTKYDRHGDILWEEEYNNPTDGNDYGTALIIDHSGDIVVVGTSFDLQNNNHDYTILKYDEDGTLLWSELFDGAANGHDIASSVTVDASDNIYVTGGSEGTGTLVDYCTVKFSSAGNFQWEARYDHQNMYDGAVSVKISGTLIAVTGGSGNDWTNGEIATVFYDSNGNEIAVRREESTETGYDQPYDLLTDNVGNIYVTGKVATAYEGFNIKTIKLDEDLELVWVNEFDGYGMDDEGRSIALDELGNVYVTGTTAKPGGGSNIITIKYDDQGEQEWAKQQHTVPTHYNARGMRIAYEDGMLVVCGERERDSGTLVTTLGYSPEGKMRFMQNFSTDSIADHLVHSLSLYENNIYIHGITQQTGADKYFALKYHYHHKESDYLYENGVPRRVDKELIIGFHPDLMKLDKIDHDHFMFAELAQFVDQSAINCINEKTGIDFSKQIATKIFPECHSWDTVSTSRLGKPVPIPAFWSILLVELPETSNDSLLLDSLKSCSKYIRVSQFNTLGGFSACEPDDPNYMAGNQAGLGPTALIADAHVNIVEAWCYQDEGSPEIKVGVIDSGIKFNHADLHDNPGSESFEGSDVAGGVNFTMTMPGDPPPYISEFTEEEIVSEYHHGTAVAGIISARIDNGLGVAGVAGKRSEGGGVSLYDLKIGNQGPGQPIWWARALYVAACSENIDPPPFYAYPQDANICLGLDIVNMSLQHWGNHDILKMATEFAFRNEMLVVTTSGNFTTQSQWPEDALMYPASFRDEWVLKIGANDNSGNRATDFSIYGNNLDFIAPGVYDIYQSLAFDNEFGYTPTTPGGYSGTSFAAPHIAGIAALMKSYVDLHSDAPNKLAPEDIEAIMQTNDGGSDPNYYDVLPVGYHEESGFGRPNAGKILEKLQLPCYMVTHFEGVTSVSGSMVLDEEDVLLDVYAFPSALTQSLPSQGNYIGDRYKVTVTSTHSLGDAEVINYWKRDAASNLAPITGELPGEGIDITFDSFSETSATLSGYIYHIVDGSNEYWWPIEPTDDAVFAYTIYSVDRAAEPCISTSIDEEESVYANIYPNPAYDQVRVEWSEWKNTSTLQIFSSTGAQVSQHIITGKSGNVDVSHLAPGLYVFALKSDEEVKTFKIVKR
ncbi:MAG: T9SS C-terminal target domain-containing protein [Cryomorphaceae bacterium]|nr:MAG: T9SS C-terminal target domain-containing protein [Cryomorphaceae bacterium]